MYVWISKKNYCYYIHLRKFESINLRYFSLFLLFDSQNNIYIKLYTI